jgi:hypothetical protein
LLEERLLTGCCGARTVNNINLFPAFIEKESGGQATRSFAKTVLILKEEKLRPKAIAIIVEQCGARGLFVQAIIFV